MKAYLISKKNVYNVGRSVLLQRVISQQIGQFRSLSLKMTFSKNEINMTIHNGDTDILNKYLLNYKAIKYLVKLGGSII